MKYKQVHTKMLEYDRIDLSERTDFNKWEDTSKKCSLCQYYYFVFKKSKLFMRWVSSYVRKSTNM